MLYEFMCGYLPFGEDCEDPYEVYRAISNSELKYPQNFLRNKDNKLAKEMIEQLLNRTPEARLGGSFAALRAHPWFESLDWVAFPHPGQAARLPAEAALHPPSSPPHLRRRDREKRRSEHPAQPRGREVRHQVQRQMHQWRHARLGQRLLVSTAL